MLCQAVRTHSRASKELSAGQAATALRLAAAALQAMDAGQLQVGQDLICMTHVQGWMLLLRAMSYAQLGSMHIWRMRLREVQLRAAIEDGSQWEAALEAARALSPFYRLVYPKVLNASEMLLMVSAASLRLVAADLRREAVPL